MERIEIAHKIVDVLEEKKGENIWLIDIKQIADFADYFVICTATSDRMLQALSDALLRQLRNDHSIHGRLEGEARDGWMIVDYGDIVVHLFSPDRRKYYRLEDLWSKGKVILRMQ